MKCPNCGKEISDKAKFCKECGKPILSEIDPSLKWGSMIVSLFLLAIYLIDQFNSIYYLFGPTLSIILVFLGYSLMIYLMYKERKVKIKYGIAWVIVPILLMLVRISSIALYIFLMYAVPAIIIDLYAMHKIYGKK